MKTDGKTKIILALSCAVGVGLLLLPLFPKGDVKNIASKTETAEFYSEYLEGRVKKLCESVDGIESAEVLLTLDCSSESVYSDTSRDFLVLSSGEEAVKLYEIYPRVRGVAVACTGGDDPAVREKLTSLLASALGIPSNRITVAGGG